MRTGGRSPSGEPSQKLLDRSAYLLLSRIETEGPMTIGGLNAA